MSLTTNTGTLTITAVGTLPAFVSGTVGTWTQIPTSNLSLPAANPNPAVSPVGVSGPAAKIVAWSSFCVDQRTGIIYSILQGGHGDYPGNEGNRFRLMTAGAVWEQIRPPTPNAQIPANGAVSSYGDGQPCCFHTYYGQWFDALQGSNGRVLQLGGAWWDPNGGGLSRQMEALDITTNTYRPVGTYPNYPTAITGGSNPAPGMAQDTRNNNIYIIGEFNIGRWNRGDPGTMQMLTPTVSSGSAPDGYGCACAFDSFQNRILILGGADDTLNSQHMVYYVDTNTYQSATLTGAAAGSVFGGHNGLQYVPDINEFYLMKGTGNTVYRIVPTGTNTFDCTVFATTGGSSIPAVASSGASENKFLYVSLLKSIVYFPSYSGNGWCLRTVPNQTTYTTSFPTTQNPLSESGAWVDGLTTGLDWNNMQVTSGNATGTAFSPVAAGLFNDNIAVTTGSFGTNYYIEGVVHRAVGYNPSTVHEIELLVRFSITPHVARGYEILLNSGGGSEIVRWNGAINDFTPQGSATGPGIGNVVAGDVIRATVSGTTLTVTKNGASAFQLTGLTWSDGNPGVGVFSRGGDTVLANMGWQSITVVPL